ncbi:MAG TPA: LytTR family DNA-binding domain-containing protein [Pararhizobium sp.]|nr:LytTR family DNA-binding domain-containing protein [Pararhizobium sp.]
MRAFLSRPRLWLTFAAVVVLFAVTGPFGTYQSLGGPQRLGFWLLMMAVAWLVCIACVVIAHVTLRPHIPADFARMIVGAVIASPLIGLCILAIDWLTFGDDPTQPGLLRATLMALPVALLMCFFVWLSFGGRVFAGTPDINERIEAPTAAVPAAEVTDPPTRLLERLDPGIRAPLLHLSVADHYVDVVTQRGHQLLLIRFADALQELPEREGIQVHRSHWVADRAVERISARDGKLIIHLTTGAEVPVSRPYAASVRARFGDRLTRLPS